MYHETNKSVVGNLNFCFYFLQFLDNFTAFGLCFKSLFHWRISAHQMENHRTHRYKLTRCVWNKLKYTHCTQSWDYFQNLSMNLEITNITFVCSAIDKRWCIGMCVDKWNFDWFIVLAMICLFSKQTLLIYKTTSWYFLLYSSESNFRSKRFPFTIHNSCFARIASFQWIIIQHVWQLQVFTKSYCL